MKKVLTLTALVAFLFFLATSCGGTRHASCDAYGAKAISTNDLASK